MVKDNKDRPSKHVSESDARLRKVIRENIRLTIKIVEKEAKKNK